jgi:biotin carboxyl carrier protein
VITAPTSGKVGTIRVRNGDTVIQGQELLTIE